MFLKHVLALLSIICFFLKPISSTGQTLSIPNITNPILIDGTPDTYWGAVKFESITNTTSGTISSPTDLSAWFKVAADKEKIYFLVIVKDDIAHSDNESNVWNDDGIEIYIDVDNDKASTFGANDFQFQFRYNDATVHEAKHDATTNVVLSQVSSADSILYEVSIPFSTLKLDPTKIIDGLLIGLDVHINDNDNKGSREGKLGWNARTDKASTNPAHFGIAQFTGYSIGNQASKPLFSQQRGFYDNAFTLAISSHITGASIQYTMDGSDPRFSATKITSASPAEVSIDPASTTNRGGKTPGVAVRAVVAAPNMRLSESVTHTYLFPDAIANQSFPEGHWNPVYSNFGWPGYTNPQNIDYAMSSNITKSTQWGPLLSDALKDIPSYSLVTDYDDMFDQNQGIYMNALTDGWERPVSVEMIDQKNNESFQINAGIRIRGRYSRLPRNAKHSFRLFFRNEYGEASLKYPVFGDEGTGEFNRLDFRTDQNSAWHTDESHSTVTFLKEVFARDASGKMGLEYTKSRFCHLYLNGMYWGLYQIQERAEEDFAKSYYGGNKSDYDIIKPEKDVPNPSNDLKVMAKEGSMESAGRLWAKVLNGMSSAQAYYEIQGMNTDGSINPAYERLLDVENLIDYLLISFYTGSKDGPGVTWISLWGEMLRPNNFIGIYNREQPDGFKWIVHDFEKSMYDKNEDWPLLEQDDRWFKEDLEFLNPVTIHRKLMANTEYRQTFADRVYKHFENGGVFTKDSVRALFDFRKAQIQKAVIGEAARWGDMISWMPANTPDNWENNVADLFNSYIPFRTDIVLNQFKTLGVYNRIKPPKLKDGANNSVGTILRITSSSALTLSNPNSSGLVYYTLDGTDPRLIGGTVSNAAVVSSGSSLPVSASGILKSRIKTQDEWSPLLEVQLVKKEDYSGLKITEIHYNPKNTESIDGEDLEFLEFKNTADKPISLTGLSLTDGVEYQFGSYDLQPGQFFVLASNFTVFSSHYGFQAQGEFIGQLRNSGEKLILTDFDGTSVFDVTYSDNLPWPLSADGAGSSLVTMETNPTGTPSSVEYWRASTQIGGSPNADDPAPTIIPVIVNEVLSNGLELDPDAIELFNPSSSSADIGGWYLTDDRDEPKKWQIPSGTTITSKSYIAFDATQFTFGLSAHGEEVFLFSANASGELTGYVHGVTFGELEEGISIGFHANSHGEKFFVALQEQTFGSENSQPKIGPIIFNKIMYNPSEGQTEYVELKNISDETVSFNGPNDESTTWKIEGLGFQFPRDITLPPGVELYIIDLNANPAEFKSTHGLSATSHVFNMMGSVDNSGETLSLYKPAPEYMDKDISTFEYILVEKVTYNDKLPWPTEADGLGALLSRKSDSSFGSDPTSWIAESFLFPPSLSSDPVNNKSGNEVTISYTDDLNWRNALTKVKVENVELASTDYQITAGKLTISVDHFTFKKDYTIQVEATGYYPNRVTQTIISGEDPPLGTETTLEFNIYPNPVTDHLTIVHSDSENMQVSVINLAGKVFFSSTHSGKGDLLDLSGLKSGVYLISISQNGYSILEKKIIKR